MTALDLIALLELRPLPVEGGYYRETWRSSQRVPVSREGGRAISGRSAGTAIYYLLTDDPDSFSALHRLPIDELYHFYQGDAVEQVRLYPDGRDEVVVLGPNLAAGQSVQSVVPAGVWQGTRLQAGGRWALLGTTMAPGFDAADYEPASRSILTARYPAAAALIRALTRRG
jgi:predicted cupin superfamily sugar epimerase